MYPSDNFYSENYFHICEVDKYNCTIGGCVFLVYKMKKVAIIVFYRFWMSKRYFGFQRTVLWNS